MCKGTEIGKNMVQRTERGAEWQEGKTGTSLLLAHSEPCKESGFQLQCHEVTSNILSKMT